MIALPQIKTGLFMENVIASFAAIVWYSILKEFIMSQG